MREKAVLVLKQALKEQKRRPTLTSPEKHFDLFVSEFHSCWFESGGYLWRPQPPEDLLIFFKSIMFLKSWSVGHV